MAGLKNGAKQAPTQGPFEGDGVSGSDERPRGGSDVQGGG